MAKDTEKLIRQLSLISFLMAERRPVTAPEIRTAVEGYSGMNEDAFARRFYADRAELESLGISLSVDRPVEGMAEQESYSLPPENFYLPSIKFTDRELAALQTALSLLDGEFAYAEPLRLALQQLSWGRPSPHAAPDQRALGLGITASAGGQELSQRLVKVDTAISRRKTIVFEYHTMERDDVSQRKVDPYQLLFQGGQFYLVGHSHERGAVRVFRLSRIRGKVAYATKAEHDFQRPDDFDPRVYANRAEWQFGDPIGEARVEVGEKIAWQVERHFGRYGRFEDGVFVTVYANPRLIVSWVLGLGEHARLAGPAELVAELAERVGRLEGRHTGEPEVAEAVALRSPTETAEAAPEPESANGRREAAIRPERFARLVTLASILIAAGREGRRIAASEVRERLQISDAELREDVQVLNVVNFGAGSYILYAEIGEDGCIEVDPDAYSDSFAQPARLLPIEAKALVAAIDLIGEHLSEDALTAARAKIVKALGHDPVDEGLQVAMGGGDDPEMAQLVSRAIDRKRLLEIEYYKENEDLFSTRRIEPYALMNGRDGWYLAAYDPAKEDVRHFRLDRIKRAELCDERFEPRPEVDPAASIDGWLRTGEIEASQRARLWISPERARWKREERPVVAELADGAVIVEVGFKGVDWLVRDVLKEAGDAVVLHPPEAREAVREAAGRLLGAAARR
ncbi:MAG: WYL domain-containing protein [Actinomycetota bacterium]|nr:WYL domain-containing protein [Actinomycetota bacterium]